MSRPGEFELINRYFLEVFRQQADETTGVRLGIGDDCGILAVPAGENLLVSVDTLNGGVHFPECSPPELLGRRALAVSVSDLAAMGASPLGFTLALCAPDLREDWLQDFSAGLAKAAKEFAIPLIGGDTTRGPLSLSVQVMGSAPEGRALLRSGAKPGDVIMVSGSLGDARAALDHLLDHIALPDQGHFLSRYWLPQPRLALGQALRGVATAAIDVSDGLAADLGHILKASGIGASIDISALPVSKELRDAYAPEVVSGYALAGGDDYELVFTVPPAKVGQVVALSAQLGLALTAIGHIEANPGLRCFDKDGAQVTPPAGYQHF